MTEQAKPTRLCKSDKAVLDWMRQWMRRADDCVHAYAVGRLYASTRPDSTGDPTAWARGVLRRLHRKGLVRVVLGRGGAKFYGLPEKE